MICTSGTSAVTSLPSVKELLKESNPPTDEQILNAVLNPEGSRDYEARMPAAELMKNPEKYKDVLRDSDFVKSYIFPSAESQTVLRWLSNVIKGKEEKVDEVRVVMLPTKTKASELTAHAGVVCLNHLRPLYGNVNYRHL